MRLICSGQSPRRISSNIMQKHQENILRENNDGDMPDICGMDQTIDNNQLNF